MPHKVIVVDDDRSVCDVVSQLISARGYDVDTAIDGDKALKLIAQNDYAAAVLDYSMPGMNGVELFRVAKKLRPDLVGIFLTAYTSINTVFPAIEAGVERVLAKPVDANELIPLLEELIGPAA